jgi:protein subunit release factor A
MKAPAEFHERDVRLASIIDGGLVGVRLTHVPTGLSVEWRLGDQSRPRRRLMSQLHKNFVALEQRDAAGRVIAA